MLVNVNVKNLALINKVDIFFKDGLNIMTGETGAGKSIIIGSILIALGGRVPKDIVRDESKEALIELEFHIKSEKLRSKLKGHDVAMDDEGTLIISRKIVNGRSNIKVNGENFTTANLKKITELLIDIHGQHDHQSLLKTSKQLEILDDFAADHIGNLKEQIREECRIYHQLQQELSEFDMDDDQRKRELDFCYYEIDEIEKANLKEGEVEEIELMYKKISSSKSILEKMNEVYTIIGDDGFGSVSQKIGDAYKLALGASENDEDLNGIVDSLADLESICNDTRRAIKEYVEEMSFDDEEAKYIEERLDLLSRLRQKYENEKKYDDPVKNILYYKDCQVEKVKKLENLEERKKELADQIENSKTTLAKLCDQLTKIRKESANELNKRIVEVLFGLNFLDARFDIAFKKKADFTPNGTDEIEFMISTNPGEELRPLEKIASGGELSRIMLGIKTIMASKDEIETLIFDEIDTGISGRTAQMVALRLKEISAIHQVICITHLPQIAAMADEHFLIEKSVVDHSTQTNIFPLDENQSVDELARMLGGAQITDAVRENAREMKKLASC
ncbi:MAG: DNA repair protein RecN [Lachnospiraceae bacterium]|nr:DNA repair protein RecN [Lachnospiraceae bacterium]